MSKNTRNRILLTALAALLLVTLTIGGTVAWLTAQSGEVTNTFTPSDINITLDENVPADRTAKMIPGATIAKDPFVTVQEGSEPCFVFVQMTKENNFDDFMVANINNANWEPVENQSGWYVYKTADANPAVVNALTAEQVLPSVLTNVTVKESVTKEQMETVTTNKPKLSFKAYAVQAYKDGVSTEFTVAEAFAKIANPAQ